MSELSLLDEGALCPASLATQPPHTDSNSDRVGWAIGTHARRREQMVDVTELRQTANDLRAFARKGQRAFSAKLVVAQVLIPLLDLTRNMEAKSGERWMTLTEAQKLSGRKRNYFEKKLASQGNRSRLEVWMQEGFADRTDEGEGPWLISPVKIAEAKADSGMTPMTDDREEDVDELVNVFLQAS